MKNLILLFLLSINNYASENIVIPKDVYIHHLEKVVKNGWSDSNETLNAFIIKSGTRAIPCILKQIHNPLSFTKSTEFIDDIPNLLISKNDYIQLFSYVKYLEHKGEEEKAYTIYMDALKGLNNIESKAMIGMLFRMVNEKTILRSLRENLKQNRFSEELTNKFKNELKGLLLLDNRLLLETIEYEYMIINKIFEASLLKGIKNQEEKRLMTKVLFYSKKYTNTYHEKLKRAIMKNSLNGLESSQKKNIEQFKNLKTKINLAWNYLKMKVAVLFSIEHDYTELAKGIAKADFLVATPYINKTYNSYINQIKNNQKLLNKLEMGNI